MNIKSFILLTATAVVCTVSATYASPHQSVGHWAYMRMTYHLYPAYNPHNVSFTAKIPSYEQLYINGLTAYGQHTLQYTGPLATGDSVGASANGGITMIFSMPTCHIKVYNEYAMGWPRVTYSNVRMCNRDIAIHFYGSSETSANVFFCAGQATAEGGAPGNWCATHQQS